MRARWIILVCFAAATCIAYGTPAVRVLNASGNLTAAVTGTNGSDSDSISGDGLLFSELATATVSSDICNDGTDGVTAWGRIYACEEAGALKFSIQAASSERRYDTRAGCVSQTATTSVTGELRVIFEVLLPIDRLGLTGYFSTNESDAITGKLTLPDGTELDISEIFEESSNFPGGPCRPGVPARSSELLRDSPIGQYELAISVDFEFESPPGASGFEADQRGAVFALGVNGAYNLGADPGPYLWLDTVAYVMHVPIHGQVPEAFSTSVTSGDQLAPPNWIFDSSSRTRSIWNSFSNPSIHGERQLADGTGEFYGRIEVLPFASGGGAAGVFGNWAEHTYPGARDIRLGRMLWFLSSFVPLDSIRELAAVYEESGRYNAEAGLRMGARSTATAVADAIREDVDSQDVPVLVEIVGHSRGGAVGALVSDLLRRELPEYNLVISHVMLDAIDGDPLGPTLPRPRARAGELVGGPAIRLTDDADFGASFYVADAFCSTSDFSWFGEDIAGYLSDLLGLPNLTNNVARDLGYPVGYPRGQAGRADVLIENSCHSGITDRWVAALESATVPYAGTDDFGLVSNTLIGQFMSDPTRNPNTLSTRFRDQRIADLPLSSYTLQFVRWPRFTELQGSRDNAAELMASTEFTALLDDRVDFITTELSALAVDAFPSIGPWLPINSPEVDQTGRIQLDEDDGIEQEIVVGVPASDGLRVEVDVEFIADGGSAMVQLLHDNAVVDERALSGEPGTGKHTVELTPLYPVEFGDRLVITVLGSAATVSRVVASGINGVDADRDGSIGVDDLYHVTQNGGSVAANDLEGYIRQFEIRDMNQRRE